MSRLFAAVSLALYTALAPGANAAGAEGAALDRAAALRQGGMKKLVFATPKPLANFAFADLAGAERHLSDWQGKWLVVNFWATWCAPCRGEMPTLQALQTALGGDRFAVVTVATGRNPVPAVQRFFAEAGVTDLPVLLDPKLQFTAGLGVLGLPVSILVDPEGNEVARLIGDADWAGDDAKAVIGALIGG
jgi:thiol-disulfide isomerase/thioredoxin